MTANPECPLPDLTAEDLLRRAVRGSRDWSKRKAEMHPRYVAVMHCFALGSTYAWKLCKWANVDPDEKVRQ